MIASRNLPAARFDNGATARPLGGWSWLKADVSQTTAELFCTAVRIPADRRSDGVLRRVLSRRLDPVGHAGAAQLLPLGRCILRNRLCRFAVRVGPLPRAKLQPISRRLHLTHHRLRPRFVYVLVAFPFLAV